MRALSGLTPALSRRLQRQLLAHLPPAAARSLRRTLSLHSSHSPQGTEPRFVRSRSAASPTDRTETLAEPADTPVPPEPSVETTPEPQCSTLPRLRRRSTPRESTPPILANVDVECAPKIMEQPNRSTERPLLSKYLTPERNLSLDESLSPEGSILSEPSYIAAYGASSFGSGGIGVRRHSLRSASDQPRKRVSRFLRSDFFDAPAEENLYAKHRKEKEMETQKILKEIREKRNKSIETVVGREPVETTDIPQSPTEDNTTRKSYSPVSVVTGKERSRSTTPFFPILDNIHEVTPDSVPRTKLSMILDEAKQKPRYEDTLSKESKLIRPKSYPVKILESIDEPIDSKLCENIDNNEFEGKEKPKESKLMRPKSYPASSPSPEKVYINRNIKKEEQKGTVKKDEDITSNDNKTDIEVSFSITLPKKSKPENAINVDSLNNTPNKDQSIDATHDSKNENKSTLVIKKYHIINNENEDNNDTKGGPATKIQNGSVFTNGDTIKNAAKIADTKPTTPNNLISPLKAEESSSKPTEPEASDKKGTTKKKIIRKVSSKSKTSVESGQDGNNTKSTTEKKKVSKKVKEKPADEDSQKSTSIPKKKSVLQSIGHKLEKFTSSKSSSPEKLADNIKNEDKRDKNKLNRLQREQSVPVNVEPPTESNLIKRAVTLTDVAALDNANTNNNKITVSKVLGLFKKFEPKEKSKPVVEKIQNKNIEDNLECSDKNETVAESASEILDKDKPRRPTSLLLNGLGRKHNYGRTSSDSISSLITENEDTVLKKETEIKNNRNSLKLDFSKLPRIKKIVPTNPVIEPLIMNVSSVDCESEKKNLTEKSSNQTCNTNVENADTLSRSRSRSRSTVSNSEIKSDHSSKMTEKDPLSSSEATATHNIRSHESVTPETDDVVDRIRRKSFYSRFNEKKQRRKSNLVGPGAIEYDPLARIHAPPTESKYDASPGSPGTYDLSPGLSVSSDQSPSAERYRSLFSELPISTRNNSRFDNYGVNDKIDTYRSLDRNEFRKYPGGGRSYLDYDQSPSYNTARYSRTKSLLENSEITEDGSLTPTIRDPLKYNRTISMYSPGSYATYRPKRTRNPAIILKESEKEPSPENILDKIRQRKNFSISVTRKPDEKESLSRSNVSSKGEGDSAECSKKVD